MTRHALVVRLDSMGDMLICGPAIRAVAATVDRVTVLAGPLGRDAAGLLPGVDAVETFAAPWILNPAPAVRAADLDALAHRVRASGITEALILTSFHQSALPTALLLRTAGVDRIAACSEDYPGSLLDRRLTDPPDAPEPLRMLAVAEAAGYPLPAGDDGRLAVRRPLPGTDVPAGAVVVHPGTSAAARAYPPERWCAAVGRLTAAGRPVVVTGGPGETDLGARIAAAGDPARTTDLSGRLSLTATAAVLDRAAVVVAANTGPAHLAAAVGTPVVSLFAPVVPALRWAPYGVPTVVLGDQHAACRGTRATTCPVPGHPCLTGITADEIVAAVDALAPLPAVVR
ncbi:glycosyltransferase family 9 protein [Nakamurella deserti]|uniref:glycosyltransferase family 9 protein n=1 Tax=Nakamurella deserti TaxID=2164074 RepID=UPI000DBEA8DC|nr:glycosyltransferase family 9 protein [Nakamurella deserti]